MNCRGYSLVELVIFIVVVSILSVGLFTAFGGVLAGAPQAARIDTATQLAQERMELILAQRNAQGIAALSAANFDPCTSVPVSTQPSCTSVPAGYTVTSNLALSWSGDANYKVVTVTVSGAAGTSLTTLLASY